MSKNRSRPSETQRPGPGARATSLADLSKLRDTLKQDAAERERERIAGLKSGADLAVIF